MSILDDESDQERNDVERTMYSIKSTGRSNVNPFQHRNIKSFSTKFQYPNRVKANVTEAAKSPKKHPQSPALNDVKVKLNLSQILNKERRRP